MDLEPPEHGASGTTQDDSREAGHHYGPRKRVMLMVGGVVLLVLAIGILPRVFLSRDLRKQKAQQDAAAPNIFVMSAQPAPVAVTVQLSGTMSPIVEAPVLARTDGYLKKRLVDIGDQVHAGQVLAVIEAPDLDQQVEQANAMLKQSRSTLEQTKASLDQARANAALAKITADRWAALVQKGAVSKQASDNYQFAYDAQAAAVGVAAANMAAASNSVSSNAANYDRYREIQGFEVVRAPFDGVITERNVDEGALVTATSTLLFRLARNDVLRTFIDVPQINAPSIKVGDTTDLTFVQHPQQVFHGTVTRTADSLNLNTRTLLTEVDIDNKDGALLPGMYATVTFHLPRSVTSILIPGEALVFRANGTTVAVVDAEHKLHFRKVAVGHDYGSSIEILTGLHIGDLIVVNPNDTAVDGATVNPIPISQATGSLAAAQQKDTAQGKR